MLLQAVVDAGAQMQLQPYKVEMLIWYLLFVVTSAS